MDGWQDTIEFYAAYAGESVFLQAGVVIVFSWALAILLDRVIIATVKRFTAKSDTRFDDQIVEHLHKPLTVSILLLGLVSASIIANLAENFRPTVFSILATIAMVVWTQFFLKVTKIALQTYANHPEHVPILHQKTLPLFENIAFILILGLSIYFIFVSWNVDMTAWLASAGIVGIAVGFAAKDTLANLFSGVFIMADAPYKIGDFVVLDGGERGEITRIGIRSTRMLTRDDIEVTVPNAVMGNTKIINESGGRHEKFRVRVQVGVAYDSDIDKVRDILQTIGEQDPATCGDPEPRVRFRRFGPSALEYELLCWIDQPVLRGRVLDSLNSTVYKTFRAEGIEIPYSKHDVYIKSLPTRTAEDED